MSKKVLIVGDSLIDIYNFGKTERVSPEAPCLVLQYGKTDVRLGGACNVATNLRTLCSDLKDLKIDFFGFADPKIEKMLGDFFISCVGVKCSSDEILTKTRYVAQNHHLLRVDRHKKYKEELCLVGEKIIKSLDRDYDLIVISDYDKGTLTEQLWEYIVNMNIPTVIDLKKFNVLLQQQDLSKCIIKCNQKEYEENEVEHMIYSSVKEIVYTCGAEGYRTVRSNQKMAAIKLNSPLIDTTGAGDVFLSAMCSEALRGNHFDVFKMCQFGNKASAQKITTFGTETVKYEEIK